MTSIRLPEDLEKRLDKLATKTHRTKSFYVREALEAYIEDMEDYYDAKKASENLGRTYTLEEIIKDHGLDIDHK